MSIHLPRFSRYSLIPIAFSMLSLAQNATAASATWTSPTSSSWMTNGNWTPSGTPGSAGATNADVATFTGAAQANVDLTGVNTRNFGTLVFDNTSTAYTIGTVGGPSLPISNVSGTAGITVGSGTLANQTINAPVALTSGSAIFSLTNNAPSAVLTLNGTVGHVATSSAGIRTLTLTGTNTGANAVNGAVQNGGTGAGTNRINVSKTGAGTWTLGAATHTYTGTTAVSDGTLLINGLVSGTGAVSVTSTGILGGIGGVSGVTSVAATAALAPGDNGIGTFGTGNLSLSGTLNAELGRSGLTALSDRASVTGTILLNNANLQLTLGSGLSAAMAGDIFWLASNDSTDAVSGVFTQLNGVGSTLTEGSTFSWNSQSWNITYLADFGGSSFVGGNDIAIQLATVPEPHSLSLVLSATILGMVLRRRR